MSNSGPTMTPMTCPSCGSPLQIAERQTFVNCQHCRTAVAINWPDQQVARFEVRDQFSPAVYCPFCSGQVLRDPNFAGASATCPHCQKEALMPGVPVVDAKACAVCGRVHFEQKCPDCERRQIRV